MKVMIIEVLPRAKRLLRCHTVTLLNAADPVLFSSYKARFLQVLRLVQSAQWRADTLPVNQ